MNTKTNGMPGMSLGNAESVERYGSYELAIEPGTSSQALITLSGIGDMSSGHIAFEFRESMRAALGGVHGLFLRDTQRSWYTDPHGWEQLLSRLRDYLTDNQIRDITCFGLSMGGFGALILASELPVTRVVAMSPRTLLSPQPYFDQRNRDLLDRIYNLRHTDALANLNPLVEYNLLFSIDEPEDTLHALRAINSQVNLLATRGDHNIGHTLRVAGKLPAFMQAIMSGSTKISLPEFGFFKPQKALLKVAQTYLDSQPTLNIIKLAQQLPSEQIPSYIQKQNSTIRVKEMRLSNREDVIQGYRLYLGRDPESEDVIHIKTGIDKDHLKKIFLTSEEHNLKASKSNIEIFIFGNCQSRVIKNCIQSMSSLNCESIATTAKAKAEILEGRRFIANSLTSAKYICFQLGDKEFEERIVETFNIKKEKIRYLPAIAIKSFHPDMIYIPKKDGGYIGAYNSRIALFSFLSGLSKTEARSAFNKNTFEELEYFKQIKQDREFIASQSISSSLPISKIFEAWMHKKISFMHSINHPKIGFMADIASAFLEKEEIPHNRSAADFIEDPLARDWSWSPFPEVSLNLGIAHQEYFFKPHDALSGTLGKTGLNLDEFIEWQYEQFSGLTKEDILLSDLEAKKLNDFKLSLNPKKSLHEQPEKINPYKGLPDYQFWRRSISSLPTHLVDPITNPRFSINREDKVATAGSCFAQHISKTLSKNGFNYFITESSDAPDAIQKNFGVYSARYGNIYSTKQLLQLFDRAYGRFTPADDAWEREDGKFVDPYRPQIDPEGFNTIEEVLESRKAHLKSVKIMFEEMDIFVFTLGLTEIWLSKIDGAVFPLAPGVAGGKMDKSKYEFKNLSTEEIKSDLQIFIDQLHSVNKKVKILLTVSPVPLMATYENTHVLSSTTLSKSILRVAADEICRSNPHVDYFPSYEIITGNYSRGIFFEDDLRSVRPEGVSQVMRLFMKHYGKQSSKDSLSLERAKVIKQYYEAELADLARIVCDEEVLDR